jgi:hypothetical protein
MGTLDKVCLSVISAFVAVMVVIIGAFIMMMVVTILSHAMSHNEHEKMARSGSINGPTLDPVKVDQFTQGFKGVR